MQEAKARGLPAENTLNYGNLVINFYSFNPRMIPDYVEPKPVFR